MEEEVFTKKIDKGMYLCSKCSAKLFSSDTKFDSGTRWPSFRKTESKSIETKPDYSLWMIRTEILCKNCGAHLGHVFDDGKECGDTHPEAGKRFCVLSKTLKFENKK